MLERLLDNLPHAEPAPEVKDDAYHAALAVERTRVLRRRLLWYCAIASVTLGIRFLWNLVALLWWERTPVARDGARLDVVSDVVLIAIFAIAAGVVRVKRPDHEGLVTILRRLWLFAGGLALLRQPLVIYLNLGPKASALATGDITALTIGLAALTSIFALHFAGSLIIPLTWREALTPVVLLWVSFLVIAMSPLYPGHWALRILLVLAFPLVGAPGVFWSWRNYELLGERFHTRVLGERYSELKGELQYARRIHESLFPAGEQPIGLGHAEVRYWYEPMREIGGDFLYLHPAPHLPVLHSGDPALPSPQPAPPVSGPVTVVVIDVSGHGVPAALAVNRLHGEIQRFFAERSAATPGELMEDLNAYAHAALAPQGMFATGVAVRLDGNELLWASAGHPPCAIRPAAGGMTILESTCVMLGVLPRDLFDPQERRTTIHAGDRILLFTDGAMDVRDERGDQLTLAELQRSFLPIRSSSDDPLEGARRRITAHRGKAALPDDCLLVQITVTRA